MYCMIFILHSLLVWQRHLCYVVLLLLVAAVCVIHRVGHLGTVVWGWGGLWGGGGHLGSAQPVLFLPPGAIEVSFSSPPPFTAITLFSFTVLAP